MMWRVVGFACALGLATAPGLGLAAAPGDAQPPPSARGAKPPREARPPPSAGTRSAAGEACTPHQRVACEGIERHAIERGDLDCRACDPAPMPPEVTQPPTAPARPLACGAREMPLSPPLPGCLPPPTDRLPPL